ncbi:MAG: hypothetical protein ACSLE6_08675 [Mycobacterium sp.]
MTLWIVIGLGVVALALVVSGLLRMREWLRRSPPLPPPIEVPGEHPDDRNS